MHSSKIFLGLEHISAIALPPMDSVVLALLVRRRGDKVAFRTSLPSRELVAHEAAHVLQYRNGRSEGGDPEVEADRAANLVASGQQVAVQVIGTGGPHLKPGDPFPGDTIKALKAVDPSWHHPGCWPDCRRRSRPVLFHYGMFRLKPCI